MNGTNVGERFELADRPTAIKVCTAFVFFLLIALPFLVAPGPKSGPPVWLGPGLTALIWVCMGICWLLFPRRFVLYPDRLVIERPLLPPTILLSSITGIESGKDILKGSIRTWGNGGFLGFQGWFWNKKLGAYRAYGTDAKKAVAIRTTGSTYVVTPQEPEAFIARLKSTR